MKFDVYNFSQTKPGYWSNISMLPCLPRQTIVLQSRQHLCNKCRSSNTALFNYWFLSLGGHYFYFYFCAYLILYYLHKVYIISFTLCSPKCTLPLHWYSDITIIFYLILDPISSNLSLAFHCTFLSSSFITWLCDQFDLCSPNPLSKLYILSKLVYVSMSTFFFFRWFSLHKFVGHIIYLQFLMPVADVLNDFPLEDTF